MGTNMTVATRLQHKKVSMIVKQAFKCEIRGYMEKREDQSHVFMRGSNKH